MDANSSKASMSSTLVACGENGGGERKITRRWCPTERAHHACAAMQPNPPAGLIRVNRFVVSF